MASASPPAQSAAAPARVIVVQRVLSEFGYGQIKPTGTLDPDTQRAIAEFENQHKLPITGRFSEQFIQELSAVTGRTLE
jgi:peptidoglycan hydrolase-like protein with peptidoglycan-binding domain